jgi:hypothetical protein
MAEVRAGCQTTRVEEQGRLWDRLAAATALLGDTASRRQPSGCPEISQRPTGCAPALLHQDSRLLLRQAHEPVPRATPAAGLPARLCVVLQLASAV